MDVRRFDALWHRFPLRGIIGVPQLRFFQYPASCQIHSSIQGGSRHLGYLWTVLVSLVLHMHVWHQSVIHHCKEATSKYPPPVLRRNPIWLRLMD